jgi:hypothetical protein
MANSGQLLAPHEVYKELEAGSDDDIFKWAKRHKFIFRDLNSEQFELAQKIINDPKYRDSFDLDKETPEADPFVIALALVEQRTISLFSAQIVVVSDENRATIGKKPKIPNICADPNYQVECIHVLDMFDREGCQF